MQRERLPFGVWIGVVVVIGALAQACSEGGTPLPREDAGGRDGGGADVSRDATGSDAENDAGVTDTGADGGTDAGTHDVGVLDRLTLEGTSPLLEAAVRAEVAGQTVEVTADDDGRFRLQIENGVDPEELVVIVARGSAARNQGSVELATISDSVGRLTARAGADLFLDETEEQTLHVSEISTARYAALYSANANASPRTRAELLTAELKLPEPLWGYEMLEAAAMLRLFVEGREPLGGPHATTLELMRDPAAVYPRLYRLSSEGSLELIQDELVEEAASVAPFDAAMLSQHYVDFLAQRGGWIGVAGDRWDFAANGTGVALGFTRASRLDVAPFSWSIDQNGAIDVELATPVSVMELVRVSDVLFLIADPVVRAQAATTLQNVDEIEVPSDLLGMKIMRVAGGERVQWVLKRERRNLRLDTALAPLGLITPAVEIVGRGVSETWHLPDDIHVQPLMSDQVIGAWVMHTRAPADRDALLGDFLAGDLVLADAFFRFEMDGTVAIDGGLLGAEIRAQWVIEVDGRVRIDYPDGTRHRIALINEQPTEVGLFHWIENGSETRTRYARARRVDPLVQVTEAALLNGQTEYWQTTINQLSYHPDPDGSINDAQIFGFQFHPAGELDRFPFYDPFSQPPLVREDYWSFTVDTGTIAMDVRYDRNRNRRCQLADPSCFSYRRRVWIPVAFEQNLLYVLETETWMRQYAEFRSQIFNWDSAMNAWVDSNGAKMQIDDRVHFTRPRLNAYYVQPVP